MRNVLAPGVISEGTTKSDEIGSALISEMGSLRMSRADRTAFRSLVRDFERLTAIDSDDASDEEIEELDAVVEDLRTLAENYTAPFCYISMHKGGGACLGVWPMDNSTLDVSEVLFVDDTSDVPTGHTGYVMHTSDHGNRTLYSASRGRLHYLWSVV